MDGDDLTQEGEPALAQDTYELYRLNNVGKFYSSQAGSSAQTVFRYAATMQDDVDPAALQHALEKTAGVFPNFNVCLRSGMFWHYLEQSAQVPVVQQENLPICYGLHVHAKSVLFRVSYHAARINLKVSHIVSDGRGSLSFFRRCCTPTSRSATAWRACPQNTTAQTTRSPRTASTNTSNATKPPQRGHRRYTG